jgi:hypothetical protein
MARFVLATGLSPSDYKKLTPIEYEAFASEVRKRNK